MEHFYIYVYLNPQSPGKYTYDKYSFNYEPFYIGKGHNDRCLHHLKEYRYKSKKTYFYNKINKIITDGDYPIVFILDKFLSEDNAFDIERNLVKTIGRVGLKTGPLTNLTDGGDGPVGYKFTKEQRDHLSSKLMGNTRTKGMKWSNENKAKISIQRSDPNYFSEETRKKISIANSGRKVSDETRHKLSLLHKNRKYRKGHTITQRHKDDISKHSRETRKISRQIELDNLQFFTIKNNIFLTLDEEISVYKKLSSIQKLILESLINDDIIDFYRFSVDSKKSYSTIIRSIKRLNNKFINYKIISVGESLQITYIIENRYNIDKINI